MESSRATPAAPREITIITHGPFSQLTIHPRCCRHAKLWISVLLIGTVDIPISAGTQHTLGCDTTHAAPNRGAQAQGLNLRTRVRMRNT